MQTSGSRIKKIRESNGISQKELANALGYKTYTTISKWEADTSLPPSNELRKLVEYFDVSADYLLGTEDYSTKFLEENSSTVEVDYIDSFNPDYLHIDTPKRKIKVPKHILNKSSSSYFVVKVRTDSLNRVIPSGENIVVLDYRDLENPLLENGDIIVSKIDGDYSMNYLKKTDSMYYLESFSYLEGFNNKEFTEEEFKEIEIIGKVIYSFNHFT